MKPFDLAKSLISRVTIATTCLVTSCCFAEVRKHRDVQAVTVVDSPVGIGTHGAFNSRTCKSDEPPRLTLTRSPKAGRVCADLEKFDGPRGEDPIVNSGKCLDRSGRSGLHVYFEPAKGFAGQDAFSYQIDWGKLDKVGDSQEIWSVKVKVNGAITSTRSSFQPQEPGTIPSCKALVS
jgi:hypothetical protein